MASASALTGMTGPRNPPPMMLRITIWPGLAGSLVAPTTATDLGWNMNSRLLTAMPASRMEDSQGPKPDLPIGRR